jgi:hypothetical protein
MPPGAGGGVPPGGGGAPGPEGGGDQSEAINELFNALIEMGVSPEQILQAAQAEEAGGGPGGAAGGAAGGAGPGGEPGPAGPAKAARAMDAQDREAMRKAAGMVRQHMNAGQARLKEAAPGTARRHERDEIKGYIKEVCGLR